LRNTAEPERMNRRKALLTAGAAPVALAAIGRARAAATVRIATLTIDSGSACFYAQDQGFFSRAGIDVQIQTIASGGAIVAAVASNSEPATDVAARYGAVSQSLPAQSMIFKGH
jgi:ABC-type nitrate/sulfonate/bicarbonate transport system substrate-binding protein